MQYQIMFYAGLAAAVVTLIITIVAFFKCNVIENVSDLLGGKIKKGTSKTGNKKNKSNDKKQEKSKKLTICDANEKKENDIEYEREIPTSISDDNKDSGNTKVLENKTNMYKNTQDATEGGEDSNQNNDSSKDEGATDILDEKDDDVTGILEEEDDGVTELLDDEDDKGFSETFVKEIDITITHIDMEI